MDYCGKRNDICQLDVNKRMNGTGAIDDKGLPKIWGKRVWVIQESIYRQGSYLFWERESGERGSKGYDKHARKKRDESTFMNKY